MRVESGNSSGLQGVIEQLKRDPSKCQEIGDRLKREDPKLFREFMQWMLNSQ